AAAGRLTRCRSLTALHLRSTRSRTYGFHQTPPSRGTKAVAAGALASSVSGSLRQGPGLGLAPPVRWACQDAPALELSLQGGGRLIPAHASRSVRSPALRHPR